MFDFDTGPQGSEGPWVFWTPRGTQDGEIPAKSFGLRTKEGKDTFKGFEKGIVFDIHAMRTGWQQSDGIAGQAPDWKWNESVSKMEQVPAGDGWKKGFSIPVAISKGEKAVWEQAGAAAWNALVLLSPALKEGPDNKLPLVKITGTKLEQFKRGSTVTPLLEVVKWVDRPDCLKEGAAAGLDAGDEEDGQDEF